MAFLTRGSSVRRSSFDVIRSHRRSRRLDLAGRPIRALARGQGARTDPWPPLRLGRVRGRAHVRRRDLQADRAYRASASGRPNCWISRSPISVAEIDEACKDDLRQERPGRLLYSPDRLARLRAAWASRPRHTKIHVAIAAWEWPSYFKPEEKAKGIRLTWAKCKRPSPDTAPVDAKAAGLYMICTLSKHAAEREGYADAMMLDWRGYVAEATGANMFFVKGRRDPHAEARLLPRRHHPPDRDRARPRRGLRGDRARTSGPRSWPTSTECFITGTAAEVTPVARDRRVPLHAGRGGAGPDGALRRLVRRQPLEAAA